MPKETTLEDWLLSFIEEEMEKPERAKEQRRFKKHISFTEGNAARIENWTRRLEISGTDFLNLCVSSISSLLDEGFACLTTNEELEDQVLENEAKMRGISKKELIIQGLKRLVAQKKIKGLKFIRSHACMHHLLEQYVQIVKEKYDLAS